MKKVSIIILETNEKQLSRCLKSIKMQNMAEDIEIIVLDNKNSVFTSAACGLNYGAGIAKGNILVFMHQDFYFEDIFTISKYYDYLIKNDNAIIGPAGVKKNGLTITDICETDKRIERGIRAKGRIIEAYTLDECMFAMTKKRWEVLKFDEKTCDNWHCYAVDICLQNLINCGENIIYPIKACHESMGNASTKEFRKSIKKMVTKYSKIPEIDKLKGTCIDIECKYISYYYWKVKEQVKCIVKFIGLKK